MTRVFFPACATTRCLPGSTPFDFATFGCGDFLNVHKGSLFFIMRSILFEVTSLIYAAKASLSHDCLQSQILRYNSGIAATHVCDIRKQIARPYVGLTVGTPLVVACTQLLAVLHHLSRYTHVSGDTTLPSAHSRNTGHTPHGDARIPGSTQQQPVYQSAEMHILISASLGF